MEPELFIFAAIFVLMLLYGASQALAWHRRGGLARLLATPPVLRPARIDWRRVDTRIAALPQPAPRMQRRQPPARRVLRTSADLKAERRIILAALAAGVEPGAIARALRGSPRYNRRRVAELAARPAVASQRRAEAAV